MQIRTTADITINDYIKGQPLTYQRPSSPNVTLNIDKGKYFGTVLDDVDKIQSDMKLLDNWSGDASEQMKIKIDKDVLGNIYADVAATNKGAAAGAESASINLGATGAPVQLTKITILDYLVDVGTVLDEANVPETGRWIVLPAWATGMLKKSDLKDASITNDGVSVLRNGRIGMIDRFTVYGSNHVTKVTDGANTVYRIMAGHKSGLTFASQMTNMETLRAESTFGTLLRGLQVYGYKVTIGAALAELYAYK